MEASGIWSDLSALAALIGVMAYALFGGADFGGNLWDLARPFAAHLIP